MPRADAWPATRTQATAGSQVSVVSKKWLCGDAGPISYGNVIGDFRARPTSMRFGFSAAFKYRRGRRARCGGYSADILNPAAGPTTSIHQSRM